MGELGRVPVELGEALLTGEAIGHAGHVGHGRAQCIGTAGREVLDIDVDGGASRLLRNGMGSVGVVLDECSEQRDHGIGLGAARRAEVDVFVVEPTEHGQGLGVVRIHADPARRNRGGDHGADERAELGRPVAAASFGDDRREHFDPEDAGGDRVFEVVTHVGDAVGPRDDLAFGGLWRREAPRMMADAIEGFAAQVQWLQGDVGAPRRVVEPTVEVGRQRVLAGVSAGPVTAVVADGDRLGEGHVEAKGLGDRPGDLGDLEGMGETGALVIVGEHEHLGLAGEPPERRVVQDAIAIPLEAGAERIGLLRDHALAGAARLCGAHGEDRCVPFLPRRTIEGTVECDGRDRVGMGDHHVVHTEVRVVSRHGRRPPVGAFVGRVVERKVIHARDDTRWPSALGVSLQEMSQFVDECQLNARGGDGGAGCVSFRREGPVAFGGPNGGDGGNGGDVWLVADHNVSSLLAFRDHPHRRAHNGVHGKGKDLHGRRGESLEIAVPMGTAVFDLYSGELLAELVHHGDRWLAAAGGRGGRGNAKFLSNKRRAPSFAEQGEHGEENWFRLELRLMADVALVGFPNAGKSTFISVISAAKPKIADYPFTTLEPNLGVVKVDDDTDFVVADIPGLIEGASEGRGLGHQFLRHVERARVMCVMVDLAPVDGVPPGEQERILLHELGEYRPELLERPRVVVGTKADAIQPDDLAALGWDGPIMSAITHQGVSDVVGTLASLVHEARQASVGPEGVVVLRPDASGALVERIGDGEFRLVGRDVERVVALNDVTTPEALSYIDFRLERLGVPKMLAKAGAQEGDVIWIGEFSFDYQPDL